MYSEFLQTNRERLPNLFASAEEEYSFDDAFEATASKVTQDPKAYTFAVNPFELEANARDVAILLDRLMLARREIEQIEAERVRLGIGYIASLNQAEAEKLVEIARAANKTAELVDAADARRKVVVQLIEELESRHSAPGGVLNYRERIVKLASNVFDDTVSLLIRALALQRGLTDRYSWADFPLPHLGGRVYAAFAEARLLDQYGAWHRQLSRWVEARASFECTEELVISLGSATTYESMRWETPEGARRASIVGVLVPDFKERLSRGEPWSFSLQPAEKQVQTGTKPTTFRPIPSRYGNPRLSAVGLSVDLAADVPATMRWRFSFEIISLSTGFPVGVEDVIGNGEVRWVESRFSNRPALDTYSVTLIRGLANSALSVQEAEALHPPISDVKMHLRFTASTRAYISTAIN